MWTPTRYAGDIRFDVSDPESDSIIYLFILFLFLHTSIIERWGFFWSSLRTADFLTVTALQIVHPRSDSADHLLRKQITKVQEC